MSMILLVLAFHFSPAQGLVDTTYQVEVTSTLSPAFNFFRHPRIPGTANKATVGYGASLRAMWHPGRLLSVGFITGYMLIADDEFSTDNLNYSARLTAVPLLVAISMQKHRIEIGMGIGPYLMLTRIAGGTGAPSRGNRLELGMTFFGSYVFELSDNIKIGPELRVLHFRYRGILSLMPSCNVRIDLLRY